MNNPDSGYSMGTAMRRLHVGMAIASNTRHHFLSRRAARGKQITGAGHVKTTDRNPRAKPYRPLPDIPLPADPVF